MHAIFRFPKFFTRYRIIKGRRVRKTLKTRRKEYLDQKERARALVLQKLAEHNLHYGFKWNRVAIKNMRSRWGSCSSKGNLNFHYRIAFLPEELLDYVIVHELCHLKAFNHSANFWSLVAEVIPDYKSRRKALQKSDPKSFLS